MSKTPEQRARIRSFSIFLFGIFAMLGVLAFLAIKNEPPPPKPLPDYGRVPLFHLTDENGQPFAEASLHGRVWIANFIFTRCPDICPLFTKKMARVESKLIDLPNVRFVSFTVDPAYDTPERLARYAKAHQADWTFLTGPTDDIKKTVVDGFKEAIVRDEGKGDAGTGFLRIVHGIHFMLVDQQGVIRGYYDSKDPKRVEALLQDARRLAGPHRKPRFNLFSD